jgi:hypothetical protein
MIFHLNLLQFRDQLGEPASPESARQADAATNLIADSCGEMAQGGGWMDPAVASRQVTLDRTDRVQKATPEIARRNETDLGQKGSMEELHQSLFDPRGSEASGNISDGRN